MCVLGPVCNDMALLWMHDTDVLTADWMAVEQILKQP